MKKIESLDDPNIDEFKSLKDKSLKDKSYIVAETEKVVVKLINSSFEVIKIFATEEFYTKYQELLKDKNVDLLYADQDLMQQIVGHNIHYGVMALAKRPENCSLEQLDDRIMVLNGLTSPENVGTIVRNCAAFGVNSLIVDTKTCSPHLRRCVRVSMGNIFNVKIHFSNNLVSTLKELNQRGYQSISTANIPRAKDIHSFKYPKKSCLIIGSEGHGIEEAVLKASDYIIKIPIDETVAALNAACSSSVFLYNWK